MTVASSNSATGAAGTTATSLTASNPYAKLGAGDYMKLLTTEMKNQDPTQPVDQTQMIAQMATFSQLSGITDMDATLKTMNTTLGSILAAQQAAAKAATATAASPAA